MEPALTPSAQVPISVAVISTRKIGPAMSSFLARTHGVD
jgi:hypothetical protein